MEKPIIQKIVVAGIVIKDNKVLIIQRSAEDSYPNLWELPSGKREFLESSEVAVIREVKEETNLKVKLIVPVSVFEYKMEKPDQIKDTTQINFLVEHINDEVKLSSEHQNFTWITKDELEKYEVSETVKEAILKAFDLLK